MLVATYFGFFAFVWAYTRFGFERTKALPAEISAVSSTASEATRPIRSLTQSMARENFRSADNKGSSELEGKGGRNGAIQ